MTGHYALAVICAIVPVAIGGCQSERFIAAPGVDDVFVQSKARAEASRSAVNDAAADPAAFWANESASSAIEPTSFESSLLADGPLPLVTAAGDLPAEAPPLAGEQLLMFESAERLADDRPSVLSELWDDQRRYYSAENLGMLAAGAGVAAVLANTNADDFISSDLYQENVRSVRTDEYFEAIHSMKIFGEGTYALPLYAAAVAGDWAFEGSETLDAAGEWGQRSLRTILVGAPPMLAMQRLIGASRPGEGHARSHWEPFADDNGVSGHSFMGAVPFIAAAQMTENRWLRSGFYLGSGMAGLSRINDNHHYASQVMLGWWMAYLAARSVDPAYRGASLQPVVQVTPEGYSGLQLEKHW